MTTLMQAHRQWMSRAPDERFTSLLEMQDFKRRIRENSRSQVVSSRGLTLRPISEDDPKETGLALTGYGCNDLTGSAMTHWSFGQLCSLASPGNSPASYFREARIPAQGLPQLQPALHPRHRRHRHPGNSGRLRKRAALGQRPQL